MNYNKFRGKTQIYFAFKYLQREVPSATEYYHTGVTMNTKIEKITLEPIRKPIIIPENQHGQLHRAFLQAEANYKDFAAIADVGVIKARAFIERLQLHVLNPFFITEFDEMDFMRLAPTVQDIDPQFRKGCLENCMRFPKSPLVQRNQLLRYYGAPDPLYKNKAALQKHLGIGKRIHVQFDKEFQRVMTDDPLNNQRRLEFATELCGLHQLTEFEGGAVQALWWAYFGMTHAELSNQLLTGRGKFAELLTAYSVTGQKYFHASNEEKGFKKTLKNEWDVLYLVLTAQLRMPTHCKEQVIARLKWRAASGYNHNRTKTLRHFLIPHQEKEMSYAELDAVLDAVGG